MHEAAVPLLAPPKPLCELMDVFLIYSFPICHLKKRMGSSCQLPPASLSWPQRHGLMSLRLDEQGPRTSMRVSLSLSHYGSGQRIYRCSSQSFKEQRVLLGCSVWCPGLVSYVFNP